MQTMPDCDGEAEVVVGELEMQEQSRSKSWRLITWNYEPRWTRDNVEVLGVRDIAARLDALEQRAGTWDMYDALVVELTEVKATAQALATALQGMVDEIDGDSLVVRDGLTATAQKIARFADQRAREALVAHVARERDR